MISKGSGFRRRSSRQNMGVECKKKGSLINEVMTGIGHEPNTVNEVPTNKFEPNNQGIDTQANIESEGEFLMVRGGRIHPIQCGMNSPLGQETE